MNNWTIWICWTYTHPAEHEFGYVLPSNPHTGSYMYGHAQSETLQKELDHEQQNDCHQIVKCALK